MQLQLEPVGEQRLYHQLHPIVGRVVFSLRHNVVAVNADPGWTAGVLGGLNSVGPFQPNGGLIVEIDVPLA